MKQLNDKNPSRLRKTPSVKLSVFSSFLIFTLIALILLWLFQVVFLETIYKSFCISQLKSDTEIIASHISSGEGLEESARRLAERDSLCISVLRPEQKSLTMLTDTSYNGCHLYYLSLKECTTLYEHTRGNNGQSLMSISLDSEKGYVANEFSISSSDELHSVIYTVICADPDDELCVLFVNSVISPVGATTKTITALLSGISIVLLLFALLFSIFVSRKITRPITEVSNKAKLFANGDYTVRFDTKRSYREIGELSDTLNFAGDELSKVENLRRELISNISHDLRTPLTLIRGYSEVMRDIPGECSPENLQTVIDETERLSSIVNEMLDYSKLESGNYTPNFERFDLTDEIASLVETYRSLTARDQYIIEAKLAGNAFVVGDRGMITRALLNLINNALTHTGHDKRVSLTQIIDGDRVRVEVSDSGHGIPPDQLEMIFERYYKADTEHKRAAIGTGLGLSIVRSVMEMHRGKYGVRSSEGVGSTFWVEFAIDRS